MARPSSSSANRWLFALLCLVLLLGAGLRLQRFGLRAPFWRDEAFIVLNVRHLPTGQLLGPLRYDQAAPPGFLLLEHVMAKLFGDGERSMRAVALISGITAMIIVAILAWRLFGPTAAVFAGGLVAFCQQLVTYSAEVKQYSSDACAAAILLFIALGWNGSPLQRLWRSAIAAAILVWFSHPAAILFAGIGAVLTIAALRQETPAKRGANGASVTPRLLPLAPRSAGVLPSTIAANALFAISFLLLYRYSIRREHTEFLYSFWGESFPDLAHPHTLLPWLFHQTAQWMNEPYHSVGYLLALLAVVAIPWLRRRRQAEVWLIALAPLPLILLAACIRQYPYGGSRLTLFTLPGFFLLAAAGAEAIRHTLPAKAQCAWWLLPISLLAYGLCSDIHRADHPSYNSYLRPAIAYLRQHRHPDEPIYCLGEPEPNMPGSIFKGRHEELLCYWPAPPGKIVTAVRSLDELRGDRFWVLIPFNSQDGMPALNEALKQLAPLATPIDKNVDSRGGAAILYERKSD